MPAYRLPQFSRLANTGDGMSVKQDLQKLNDHLDKYRRKLIVAEQRNDLPIMAQFKAEIDKTTTKIADLKGRQSLQVGSKAGKIKALAFNRALTKSEQADLGKLKKTVRGLVVVHPMTALGRDMGAGV
jgi:ribosome-associated protein